MKTLNFKIIAIAFIGASSLFVSCDNTDSTSESNTDQAARKGKKFSGTFVQQDQMARPAINTVFIGSGAPKDAFNASIPSEMGASYQGIFQSRLLALNSGYTTNALGQTAAQLTGLLSTDVLNVSKVAPTTFFDGTNVLTGRNAADDVIDVELLLIFGGPTGASNPGLTSDHVNSNDKSFTASFPYLASAW
ncbi:DUF4331 family protein [Flavobacterium luteum]|uniref:DUF4331 domain-containing protein n=1 Tax=Flavobacterium luteum TaxID=2026654 RepID=A0A7J5AJZ2_9FLAO|nr:DUF4331 family protein [Flavobacterium luteum]KAB1157855.1 DUF4331 domain-containing protein [Flavobacterium luteum]